MHACVSLFTVHLTSVTMWSSLPSAQGGFTLLCKIQRVNAVYTPSETLAVELCTYETVAQDRRVLNVPGSTQIDAKKPSFDQSYVSLDFIQER